MVFFVRVRCEDTKDRGVQLGNRELTVQRGHAVSVDDLSRPIHPNVVRALRRVAFGVTAVVSVDQLVLGEGLMHGVNGAPFRDGVFKQAAPLRDVGGRIDPRLPKSRRMPRADLG
jgi:hypothetical protein